MPCTRLNRLFIFLIIYLCLLSRLLSCYCAVSCASTNEHAITCMCINLKEMSTCTQMFSGLWF